MMKRAPRFWSLIMISVTALFLALPLGGCGVDEGDEELTKNTYLELVDWHVTGFWVINYPVCWIRVKNLNGQPIKNIKFQYTTYNYDGTPLSEGTYTIEDHEVQPNEIQNIAELYVGWVDLHSDKLSIKLISVSKG